MRQRRPGFYNLPCVSDLVTMHSVCALLQQGILVLLLVTSGILCSSRRDTEAVSNAFSSTTSSSEHLDTRFPPRHYSFDPRPNIDLSALVSGESASTLTSLKVDDNFQGDTSTENSNKGNSVAGHPEVSASPEGITDQNDGSTRTHADEKLEEGPRAIVDVQRQSLSGVSYIIHPDNLPPPSYEPLKDLPPPSHPVAQWRPDLFIKVCCSPSNETISDSNENSTLIDIHTGYAEIGNKTDPENKGTEEVDGEGEPVGSYLLNDEETVKYSSDGEKTLNISQDKLLQNCGALQEGSEKCRDSNDNKAGDSVDVDDFASTEIPGNDEGQLEPTATSERSSSNFTQLVVELGALGDAANKHFLDASSNHTPRYEESGSTTYQDMANFLKDIANSDGFQNAFLGDLISNFGSLDQNAMKLIYSLLIRPLEAAHQGIKTDRMGASPNTKLNSPNHLPSPSMTPDFLMLNKDKLPLRDEPANGYHPFFLSPPQKSPTIGPARAQLRPSPTVQAVASGYSDQAWLPTRSLPRKPSDGLRGDENVDVITAPPFQNFEVVLGSSLNHDGKSKSHPQAPQPSQGASQHPLPFDKLRLGLEMPPPDALEALPPGSVLIPPSYILKQAKLPQIITKKDGTPGLEMSFPDFLPNLPFFGNDKPQRMQPPAKPQAHDIPPRLPSFLSSFLSGARPHSRPEKGPPVRQRPLNRHMFLPRRPPTAPPPPVTKLTPPATRIPTRALPTAIVTSLSPTFTPPPPPVSYVPHKPIDQETPNVLPNSVNPSGLSVAGPIPVPVFVSVPPKKDSVAAASPAQVQSGGPSMHHEESPQKDHMDKVHYQIESASTTGNVVIGEGEAQSPKDYPLIYEEYPDAASHDNSSDTNYHNHEYYDELPPDYILEYYDYQDYYDQQLRRDGLLKTGSSSEVKSGSSDSDTLHNQEASHTSAITNETNASDDHDGLYSPSVSFEPEISPTLSEQEQSDLQMLLQNHQMAAALAEANSTVLSINSTQIGVQSTTKEPDTEFMDDHDYYDVPITSQRGNPYLAHPPPSAPSFPSAPSPSEPLPPAEVHFGSNDLAVSHLWNNIQLIPLAPELFDTSETASEDNLNLTSLFYDAVPISPTEHPNIKNDLTELHWNNFDTSIDQVSAEKELTPEEEVENAKFMAYVLIGACCGLALLSVAGIIVIIRFKKTCGSRQIRTRTRLTEQNSIEDSSRLDAGPVDTLTLGGESGHKLGSWFTGRHEHHLGSGKLRSNMTLPDVHDLKREKNKTGSTRDLLSLTSESSTSSRSSSPRQGRGGARTAGESRAGGTHSESEEPRGSWLHGEYRASNSDLSQTAAQDLAYIPRHYHGRDPHPTSSSSRPTHPLHTPHQQESFRYRTESSMESEELKHRSSREHRYTAEKTGKEDAQERMHSGRRPRYVVSSLESEELNDHLGHSEREPCTTDSEAEDRTTHYDEDDSRDPSCYTGHSRELDDTVASRGAAPVTSMTSQELGDHLSRDLKQYQTRRSRQHQEDKREAEGDEGTHGEELQRSQSQVSFSRDNVQNEVFLEFDNIFRQHGQYLSGDPIPPASTLGRVSRRTTDTLLSVSRANTPDSIDMSHHHSFSHHRDHRTSDLPSPPTTPPRFSPPPAPPRPPKPGHLSQPGTPSPKANRARPPSPGEAPPSPPRHQHPSGNRNSEEERLI